MKDQGLEVGVLRVIFWLLTSVISVIFIGCGYQSSSYIKGATTIAIPLFENNTLWRGCEFELSNIVRGEVIARTSLRIAKKPEEADLILSGEIVDYTRPVLVEDVEDRVVQSQISLALKVFIKDRRIDKIIYEGSQVEASEFITSRGENEAKARREVYDKLARWVVSLLEDAPEEFE